MFSDEQCGAAKLLEQYRPECLVSGHSHQFPYFEGSNWALKIDGVNVFVPWQLLSAQLPNHIILNTERHEGSWQTSSQAWIPEDGLCCDPVLKFPEG